ncbi:hypothetical protein PALB_31550 [Pseudoalteromonas luteoviolacea B = ATCC 29581]|nr:hypothetical protein PALB_31550 [Pseudoalteromonas luteoviolacea B = ATCC 29581]
METFSIPLDYLNTVPWGTIVVKMDSLDLNHKIVYVNNRFMDEIGYSTEEIPDKDTWWRIAYPDESYRLVVTRLWELAVQETQEKQAQFVSVDAIIQTKMRGQLKYRVMADTKEYYQGGYYAVQFMRLDRA